MLSDELKHNSNEIYLWGVMAKVERFEDLVAWQKARQLVREIYSLTSDGHFMKDYGLRDQIRRAGVSIMSNIAEGFERFHTGEFHQFLMVSKASCAEVRSHLFVALDAGYMDQTRFDNLQNLAVETSRIIGGLRVAIYKKKVGG